MTVLAVPTMRRAAALIAAIGAVAAIAYRAPGDEAPALEIRRNGAARLMADLMSGTSAVGGPFTLQDASGKRVSLSDFRGKVVLLYFGYMFCPDVCPTDLAAIGQCVRALGAAGDEVQPIFITLDPGRDKGQALRDYAAGFHPRFVALTGSTDEVQRIATAYKIYFARVRPPGAAAYLIDHTAFVFLLDREGRFVAIFPPGTPARRMEVLVREQLARPASS